MGIVKYIHLNNGLDTYGIEEQTVSVGQDQLVRMVMHKTNPNIFATGGKERELSIYDINTPHGEKEKDNKDEKEKQKTEKNNKQDYIKPPKSVHPEISPIWKAKNVKHNELSMRVPVHITDILWTGPTNLVISTFYKHIREYDYQVQKRPLISHDVGDHPIKALGISGDSGVLATNEVCLSDTVGTVTSIDKATGLVKGRYRGIAGCVTQIVVFDGYMVCVGLDRYLRVFESKGMRREVQKVSLVN
jgi:ribosome biogenesis protein NSA1